MLGTFAPSCSERTIIEIESDDSENELKDTQSNGPHDIVFTYPSLNPTCFITNEDLGRLEKGEYLNDTLVHFSIKVLSESNLIPDRVLILSTYFYTKCATQSIDVLKWVKDVDFWDTYDCLIIPVNASLHWTLVLISEFSLLTGIISHSTKSPNLLPKHRPKIFYFDSLGGEGIESAYGNVMWFLNTKWANDFGCTMSIQDYFVFGDCKVPKQPNAFDCGVYMIMYIEKIIDTIKNGDDSVLLMEKQKWFTQKDVDSKREAIKMFMTRPVKF